MEKPRERGPDDDQEHHLSDKRFPTVKLHRNEEVVWQRGRA